MKRRKDTWRVRLVIFLTLLCFGSDTLYAQVNAFLPNPGTFINPSASFAPALLRGVTIHPDDPFQFDFILEHGQSPLTGKALKKESEKLVKYFLASLTIPDDDLWVNLSPYEKNRIVPDGFGQTEMGRDLLSQDYLLKQLTASLLYPEGDTGKKFWERVYAKAFQLYGTTNIPVDTFNKVWIIPEKAVVYEKNTTAFVIESHLKVMVEEDYKERLKTQDTRLGTKHNASKLTTDDVRLTTEIIREIVIPEIEREVNEGTHFAPLRQIYGSLILAC